jgi:hypothetical protein
MFVAALKAVAGSRHVDAGEFAHPLVSISPIQVLSSINIL